VGSTGGAQGWFVDPFDIHQHRWYSDGRPSNLVRDHGVESYDDPPPGAPPRPLVPAGALPPRDPRDTRADEGHGARRGRGRARAPTSARARRSSLGAGTALLVGLLGALLVGFALAGSHAPPPPDQVQGLVVRSSPLGTVRLAPGQEPGHVYFSNPLFEVSYTVRGRGPFTIEASRDQLGPATVGDTVQVAFDPANPAHGRIVPTSLHYTTGGFVAGVVGVALVALAIVGFRRPRRGAGQPTWRSRPSQ